MSVLDRRCSRCDTIALLVPLSDEGTYCRRCLPRVKAIEAAMPMRCGNESTHRRSHTVATVLQDGSWVCVSCVPWTTSVHFPRFQRRQPAVEAPRVRATPEIAPTRSSSSWYSGSRTSGRRGR